MQGNHNRGISSYYLHLSIFRHLHLLYSTQSNSNFRLVPPLGVLGRAYGDGGQKLPELN